MNTEHKHLADIDIPSILTQVITVLLTIVISMTGFWLMIGREFVTRSETSTMINNQLLLVQERVSIYKEDSKELRRVIDRNSEALTDLKVQIGQLKNTLDFLREDNEN